MTTILRQLWHRDDGSAMTEFVICLPVFVLIFIGIADLGKLVMGGAETKIRANAEMWNDALPVQKNIIDPVHMSPTAASLDAGTDMAAKIGPYPLSEAMLAASYVGLLADGTRGESFVMATWGSVASLDVWGLLTRNRQPTVNFAEDTISDNWPNPVSGGPGVLGFWTPFTFIPPVQWIYPRQSIAAGLRYGQEEGDDSITVPTAAGPVGMSEMYDVMVAPRPVSLPGRAGEFIPVAFSRLGVEEYGCASSLLGIEPWPRHILGCPTAVFWPPPIGTPWMWNTPMPPPPMF